MTTMIGAQMTTPFVQMPAASSANNGKNTRRSPTGIHRVPGEAMIKQDGRYLPTKSKIMNKVIRMRENQSVRKSTVELLSKKLDSKSEEREIEPASGYGLTMVTTPGNSESVTKNTSHTVNA